MDLEPARERTETVKAGFVSRALKMEGPKLPPAPMIMIFLRGWDIVLIRWWVGEFDNW